MSTTKVSRPSRGRGRPRSFDRDEALSEALTLFSRKGYNQTSVADLCTAMGISPSSLYSAFGNKASLFIETVDRYERTYWAPIVMDFHAEPDVRQAFLNMYNAVAEIMTAEESRQGWMAALSAVTIAPDTPEVAHVLADFRARSIMHFHQRLLAGVGQKQIRENVELAPVADTLYAVLDGMAVRAKEGLELAKLRAIGRLATDLIPLTWESSRWDSYLEL